MPPKFFNIATQGQTTIGGTLSQSPQPISVSQAMLQNTSASQPRDQEALISHLVNQMKIQNLPPSASQLTGPMTPEESRVCIMQFPYHNGTTFVYYDPGLGTLMHVNVSNPLPVQRPISTNAMVPFQVPIPVGTRQQPQGTLAGQPIGLPTLQPAPVARLTNPMLQSS